MAIDERIRGLGYDRAADQRSGGRDDNRLEYSVAAALQPPAPPTSNVQAHIIALRQRADHNYKLIAALIESIRPVLDESDKPQTTTARGEVTSIPPVACSIAQQLSEIHGMLQEQTNALEITLGRIRV